MRRIAILIFLMSILLTISCTNKELKNQSVILNYGWKLKLGDSVNWISPNYNDSHWGNFNLTNSSRNDIFKTYDGYAWYRIKFSIPSSLKNNAYSQDSLKFVLGPIDNCDQVYLNGSIIGENTLSLGLNYKADPDFKNSVGLWNVNRNYLLSVKDSRILWDKVNTIAIRIFDQNGDGGITNQAPAVRMRGLEDFVIIDKSRFYKEGTNGYLNRELKIKNKLKVAFVGNLIVTGKNVETKKKIYKTSFTISLDAGQSVVIPFKLPVNTDPTLVWFKLKDNSTNYVIDDTETVPYVLADIKFKNTNN